MEPKIMSRRASAAVGGTTGAKRLTLADVDEALGKCTVLTPIRRRDLQSATRRVARLLKLELGQIPLDLPTISQRLGTCMPAAAGLTDKTFANLKSDFLAATRAAGLKQAHTSSKTPISPGWRKLKSELSSKRVHLGLSRLARWCSGQGIEPEQVNDAVLAQFIGAVREGTLHRKPNELHRNVAKIWNEVVQALPRWRLKGMTVPSFRQASRRLDWSLLPESFRDDLEAYSAWSSGSDLFAEDARPRRLAPQTIKLHQNHIRAAVTALIESGSSSNAINSLGDLVTLENFKRILRRRHEMVSGKENTFNRDLARTLVEIGRRWVKLDVAVVGELRRIAAKVPAPLPGLTAKNKERLRQFDDPENLRRLIDLPERLWAEVKRDKNPTFRTLLKAQAALAIGMSCYMPIRPQNLCALKFDEHIFLHAGWGAISTLELPAAEVKNRTEVAFDIPSHLAKMLVEYRNKLVPKVIGKRPDRIFIKADGSAKNQWAVAWLIRTVLRRRLGLQLSAHGFRHLSAKTILDREPGNFETVRQLLGHKSLRTTVGAYAGISTRRAARHHQQLLQQALQRQHAVRGR
jgi:integrase